MAAVWPRTGSPSDISLLLWTPIRSEAGDSAGTTQRGSKLLPPKEGRLGAVPVVAEPEERVDEVIEELRKRHAPVIVDTAGFRNRTTIGALVATDLALIPLKPAVEDVDAAIGTYELIREINEGRPIKVAMILTMTLRGTVIARHVRDQLADAGYPLLKAEMLNRVAYPEAGIEGLSPCITDSDGAAARDIAAIAQELMKLENHEFTKEVAA